MLITIQTLGWQDRKIDANVECWWADAPMPSTSKTLRQNQRCTYECWRLGRSYLAEVKKSATPMIPSSARLATALSMAAIKSGITAHVPKKSLLGPNYFKSNITINYFTDKQSSLLEFSLWLLILRSKNDQQLNSFLSSMPSTGNLAEMHFSALQLMLDYAFNRKVFGTIYYTFPLHSQHTIMCNDNGIQLLPGIGWKLWVWTRAICDTQCKLKLRSQSRDPIDVNLNRRFESLTRMFEELQWFHVNKLQSLGKRSSPSNTYNRNLRQDCGLSERLYFSYLLENRRM